MSTDRESAGAFSGLQTVVIEDSDHKYGYIEALFAKINVPILGRLATMDEVLLTLRQHKTEGRGVLQDANVFFVDGNLSDNSDNGRDGNNILVAFVERGIAYPASAVAAHRDWYPEQLPGLAFGCSNDPGGGAYGTAVHDYNLYARVSDADAELARMMAMAVELLPPRFA